MKAPAVGIEFTPDDAKAAGAHADGFEFTNDYFAPTDDNPRAKEFYEAYKAEFDQEPDFYAANYYEAIYVIAELLKPHKEQGIANPTGAQPMAERKARIGRETGMERGSQY